jgi:hypothetical protein
MVRQLILIIVCLSNLSASYPINAQTVDSIDCEKYFEYLQESNNRGELITRWVKMPVLKECNHDVLSNICDLYSKDTVNRIIATLVIDKEGNPVCIHTNIKNDSLKILIINWLYKLKFEPAIGFEKPVLSHYPIIIDSVKCKYYLGIGRKKKKKK